MGNFKELLEYIAETYPKNDTQNRGQAKQVLMAADDSVFVAALGRDPRCTVDYPSLAVQQARQQALWEADERLQRLLPDGPAKLPDTRIIADIVPDHNVRRSFS